MKQVINFVGQFLASIFFIVGLGMVSRMLAYLFMWGWKLATV